jgi:hypothetical protein
MNRLIAIAVFVIASGAVALRCGIGAHLLPSNVEVRSLQQARCPHCSRCADRCVPMSRPRSPQRFDDGRQAPAEATSTRRPLGEAPPAPH